VQLNKGVAAVTTPFFFTQYKEQSSLRIRNDVGEEVTEYLLASRLTSQQHSVIRRDIHPCKESRDFQIFAVGFRLTLLLPINMDAKLSYQNFVNSYENIRTGIAQSV
jgi:hypothetical protein